MNVTTERLLTLPAFEDGGNILSVLDMHTAGEPVRIFDARRHAGEGGDVLVKRRRMRDEHDWLRQTLMLEPRGHQEMYGAFLVEPSVPAADAAVLFTHGSGYSTMCGHATIALGRMLYDLAAREGEDRNAFLLECPCGLLEIEVTSNGRSPTTAFLNVESFAAGLGLTTVVPGYGRVEYDLGYGGAYYAVVSAGEFGLDLLSDSVAELASAASALVSTLRLEADIRHLEAPDLGFLYGAIITSGDGDSTTVMQNLCWFGAGQIDRSPTGSGVAARLAVGHAKGLVAVGDSRRFAGPSGDCFESTIVRRTKRGVIAEIRGRAFYVGRTDFSIDPADPFRAGFTIPTSFDGREVHCSQEDA